MKFKILLASLLAVLLIGSQAGAVSIKRRDVSSIPDILKQSCGLAEKDSDNLDLSKASFIRIHDDGQLDLRYNIGNGDKDLSLKKINGFSTTNLMRDNGILTVLGRAVSLFRQALELLAELPAEISLRFSWQKFPFRPEMRCSPAP